MAYQRGHAALVAFGESHHLVDLLLLLFALRDIRVRASALSPRLAFSAKSSTAPPWIQSFSIALSNTSESMRELLLQARLCSIGSGADG